MNLVRREGNLLLSSDWHVLHRNIYWFVSEARSLISGIPDVRKLDDATFMEAERVTYGKILEDTKIHVEQAGVDEFVFLGDLVFGLDKRRGLEAKLETIATEIPALAALFSYLQEKGIQRTMILGNHDDYKGKNPKAQAFYEAHFDRIVHSVEQDGVLFTHFPLGYSLAQAKTQGTPEEKFFRMSKTFRKIDQSLLEKYGDGQLINYHGHIHQGNFPYALPQVDYRNMAIDIMALSTE